MSLTAASIIRRATDTMQDITSIRWPANELVRYLNDGQREIVMYRPDAMVTNATSSLVAGSKQSLPANGTKLIEIVRNNSSASKKSVRITNREILDAQTPNWHSISGSSEILHFMYDVRDPKVYYVYPPALVSAALDIVYAALPTDIVEPSDGALFSDVVGNISVPDIYGNVLLDYILYRSYAKNSEYAGNAQRAQAHYAAFGNALGVEMKATVAFQPISSGNPNTDKAVQGS